MESKPESAATASAAAARLLQCRLHPSQIKYNITIVISLHASFADQRSGRCASKGAGMMTKLRRELQSQKLQLHR